MVCKEIGSVQLEEDREMKANKQNKRYECKRGSWKCSDINARDGVTWWTDEALMRS